MSAFECNVTPTRIRNAKKRDEDKEPTIVDLRPFTGKSIVTFEDVPVTKIARRIITVINPFTETLKISITKRPKPEYNVALEWTSQEIGSEGCVNLEVLWNPLKIVSCRDVIEIVDQFGNKKSVAIILKSCELKKTTTRKVGGIEFNKKLKLKPPSFPRMISNQEIATSVSTSTSARTEFRENFAIEINKNDFSSLQMSPKRKFQTNPNTVKSPLRNSTNIQNKEEDILSRTQNNKKESVAITPTNATSLFDNIKFTPLTETKPKCESKLEYLSSLPTPTTATRDDIKVPKEIFGRKNILQDMSPEVSTPHVDTRYDAIGNTTMYRETLREKISNFNPSKLVLERNEEYEENEEDKEHLTYIKPSSLEEINEIEIILTSDQNALMSKTQALTPTHESDANYNMQKTFHVNKSDAILDNIISKPISSKRSGRRLSESMRDVEESPASEKEKLKKCIQGSMPNLNDICEHNFEHNRYFNNQQQHIECRTQNLSMESVVSNTDFKEIETCAQSSRLNLNEIGRPRKSSSPINIEISPTESPLKFSNQQQSKMSKKSPKKYYLSPTIQRIREEQEFCEPQASSSKKLLIFSPPKFKKSDINEIYRRETFVISKKSETRATTWKQQQNQHVFAIPKVPRESIFRTSAATISQSLTSLSSSVTSIASTCSMPVTSGRLYNENFVNAYSQKDPFSASTTVDPFLSSSLYLDEQTLDGIEKSFKKWLNALVTIPPDLEADHNEKIDVAKLFNDVQNKELTLAPTKEIVCSQYYTARLDQLRGAAVRFFHSEEISKPLNKLAVIINEKKLLEVHSARSIHLDLVLQRSLLELLLCFNPLWLRIGLEVVFNVQLNLTSNQDIYGMCRFIITNMFRSTYLQQKYNKYHQQQELLDKLKKHTAKNFLFLLFFLDRAKESRLIKQNPCLFIKVAPYKETVEILKKFASLVLANYGDIIRMMKRIDYVLTHKQTVIDEFDFAFKNLAIDLRDGVRLTKVMEVILLRDDLVKKVRVPAISRLQKVHNVELALKALEAAEYEIIGNITAKDIADGHREKTLSLLWQIIYKFRAPRFNAAAKTIQKFWRSKWLKIVIERRIKMREQERMNSAATIIQKYFRGWQLRKSIEGYRKKVLSAVIILQRFTRVFLERKKGRVLMIKERNRFIRLKELVLIIEERFRLKLVSRQVRKEYLRKLTAIIKIQQFWRSIIETRKQRANFLKCVQLIIFVQRKYRAHLRMKKEREKFLEQRMSAIKIQKYYHGYLLMKQDREEYLKIKRATLSIQRMYKALLAMKSQKMAFQRQKESSIKIQKYWRNYCMMRSEREQYLKTIKAIITIQQKWKSTLKMRETRTQYRKLRDAIIKVQQRWKATLKMRMQQVEYRESIRKIVWIQRQFRANMLMRNEKKNYNAKRCAIIKIQRHYRSYIEMKQLRREFLTMKKTVILVENRIIANRMGKVERNNYERIRNLIIKVQQVWRSNIQMKKLRNDYQKTVKNIIYIQQKYRGKLQMRKDRKNYLIKRSSVIKIQKCFRGYMMMKQEFAEFQKIKSCAVTIQQRYRAYQAMKLQRCEYSKKKNAAVHIQRKWRGYVLMKKKRNEYLNAISLIKVMQLKFRNKLEMRRVRYEFLKVRGAVITIQRIWRGILKTRQLQLEYKESRSKIMWIQRKVRANQAMRLARDNYQRQKSAALVLQKRYRARIQMKIVRNKFMIQKRAVAKIQNYWRSYALMKKERTDYIRTISIIRSIQIKFRSKLIMRNIREKYLIYRMMVIKIQQRWRATLEMRKQKIEYQRTQNAIVLIQRRFRAAQAMRVAVNDYQQLKSAIINIQKWFRSYREMTNIRNEFLLLKKTVLLVENRIIANRLKEDEQKRFIKLRETAIFIQRRFRSKIETRLLQEHFKKSKVMVLRLQCHIRGYLARKRFKELQTPENIEKRRRHKAARMIQAAWRGYKERSKKSNMCFRVIVERLIKVSRNIDPTQTLAAKLKISIDFLKYRYDSNLAISTLAKLEYMSRTVPWILNDDAEFISAFCYGIMAQAIRSEIDKQIIELCSCIILNLGRYHGTKEDAFQESGLITIAQMLLRWCDKDCGIFNTLCTLVWVFSHCDKKKSIIRKFMTMKDGEFIMCQIKQNVLRKENMRKNSRRPIGFQSISLIKYKKDYQLQMRHQPQTIYSSGFISPEMLKQCRQFPTLDPDYGVVRMHPYIFYSSVFAFDMVLQKLDIVNVK